MLGMMLLVGWWRRRSVEVGMRLLRCGLMRLIWVALRRFVLMGRRWWLRRLIRRWRWRRSLVDLRVYEAWLVSPWSIMLPYARRTDSAGLCNDCM